MSIGSGILNTQATTPGNYQLTIEMVANSGQTLTRTANTIAYVSNCEPFSPFVGDYTGATSNLIATGGAATGTIAYLIGIKINNYGALLDLTNLDWTGTAAYANFILTPMPDYV